MKIAVIGKLILIPILWLFIGASLTLPFRILADHVAATEVSSICVHIIYFVALPPVLVLGLFWPTDRGWPWRKILRDALILSFGIWMCLWIIAMLEELKDLLHKL